MENPWGDVAPAVVASVITTLATMGITSGARGVRKRSEKQGFPVLIKRGSGHSFEVVNQSKRPFTTIQVEVISNDGSWQSPLGWSAPALLPQRSVPIGDIHAGAIVKVQWSEFRRGKEKPQFAEIVRIRDDVEEYRPKKIDEPPLLHGG